MENWAKRLAEIINPETVPRAFGLYVDNYFATSEPLRKFIEQWMHFWLSNLHMPSREEITDLSEQVQLIASRLDRMEAAALQGESASLPPSSHVAAEHTAEDLRAMLQEMDARSRQLEARNDRMDNLETRLQMLDSKTDQIMHLLNTRGLAAQGHPASRADDLEACVQSLDQKAEQLLQMLQNIESPPDTD
jgi:chromosome segregation ATPase